MTPNPLLLRLLGWSPDRERAFARDARRSDREARDRPRLEAEARFLQTMEDRARTPHLLLGTTANGTPYRFPLSELPGTHLFGSGTTGSGKSTFASALGLQVVRSAVQGSRHALVVVDCKGDTAALTLDGIGALARELAPRARDELLSRLVVVRPFRGPSLTPYPILAPEPSITPIVQATAIAETIDEASKYPIGTRQSPALSHALVLAISLGWTVLDLRYALYDRESLARLAEQVPYPETRVYFRERFLRETPATLDGLAARIDTLLRIDDLRAMFAWGGEHALDVGAWFRPGAVTVLDLGGASMGSDEIRRAVGALLFGRIARAIFDDRRVLDADTLLLCDEIQTILTSHVATALDRIVSLARSFRVSLASFHQSMEQMPKELQQILATNLRLRVLGRSGARDAELADEFLPITGTVPKRRARFDAHLDRPELLSAREERALRIEEVGKLPRQHFLVADRAANFHPLIVRAPDFAPVRIALQPAAIRERVLAGHLGVRREQCLAEARRVEEAAAARLENKRGSDPRPRARRRRSEDLPNVVSPRTRGKGDVL